MDTPTTHAIRLTSDPASKAQPWVLVVNGDGTVDPAASTDHDVWALAGFRTAAGPQAPAVSVDEFLADPTVAIGTCPTVHVRDHDDATYLAPVGAIQYLPA